MIPADYFGIDARGSDARRTGDAPAGHRSRRPAAPWRPAAHACVCTTATAAGSTSTPHAAPPGARAQPRASGSNTPSTSPASPTRRSSPPPETPRSGRTCCGRRSAPRRSTSCTRILLARRRHRLRGCAARARKPSTTRRSSPTARSWRSTTRGRPGPPVGPVAHLRRGRPLGHRPARRPTRAAQPTTHP